MAGVVPGDFILAPGEQHIQCPYNFSHVVTNARLIVHLDKCRRGYEKECLNAGRTPEFVECRFNYSHKFYKPEIKHHEDRCSDRYNVVENIRYHNSESFAKKLEEDERRRFEDSLNGAQQKEKDKKNKKKHRLDGQDCKKSSNPKKRKLEHDSQTSAPHAALSEEDWEAESDGYKTAYDPKEKLNSNIILYHPMGLSKSERKQFRLDQRQKAATVTNVPEEDFRTEPPSTNPFKDDIVKQEFKQEKKDVDEEEATVTTPSTSAGSLQTNQSNPPIILRNMKTEIKIELKKEAKREQEEEECFGYDPFC